jgi:predicted RNA-binding protein with RPS1 domain
MEMSEQKLVQATEVSAPSQEPQLQETQPQETQPVETMPSDTPVSAVNAPEATPSEATPSEATPSEATPSEATTPVASTSDAAASETADGADGDVADGDVADGDVADGDAADEDGPVVKLLSVGQALQGTVKRITEFGAFVDIGVGRDGLVHISELSTTRVAKVSDLLKEGQAVTLWIKKLDRDRNRISLTMIEPGQRTIRDLQVGEVVPGTVTRILPYGAFIDIGVGRDALLHVREMAEGFVAKPEDVVKSGDAVEVRIIEIARRRNRIDVSMKGLRPEPEPVQSAVEETQAAQTAQEEAEYEDRFAEMEALTTMQVAFLKAQERSGVVLPTGSNKKQKRNQSYKKRSSQDAIIERTLSSQGKK